MYDICLQVQCGDAGHCAMYGQCGKNIYQSPLNCEYNGPAKQLSVNGQKLLSKHCPQLLHDEGKGVFTCCDEAQLKTFDTSIQLAANFLARCPSCMRNLVRHLCDFTCSPDQATFVNVTHTEKQNG